MKYKKIKKNMGVILERMEGKFYAACDYSIFELNEVGARILELCNGSNDVEEIANKLSLHYAEINKNELLDDVKEYINILSENELIREID